MENLDQLATAFISLPFAFSTLDFSLDDCWYFSSQIIIIYENFFVNSLASQSYSYMKQTQNAGVYELADDENNYHLVGPTACEYENSLTGKRYAQCIK